MLIDALLGDDDEDEDEDRETRGIKDYWEKVKNYFKDLKIDLQEKYMKFGEWVKEVIDKGLEHSKDKMENIKAIAKEVTILSIRNLVCGIFKTLTINLIEINRQDIKMTTCRKKEHCKRQK